METLFDGILGTGWLFFNGPRLALWFVKLQKGAEEVGRTNDILWFPSPPYSAQLGLNPARVLLARGER